ncbi:NAD(P)-binding protein [Aureobasidium namibiae CBS 147.97]|uniref:NAD(P)-binding protein n=1 Tax=Aureobasidium namibiae CBS 147.97 TaxID=1043004 RepID=A0A074X514_9PEZI
MLAIIGASGKLGGATLKALLDHNLLPKSQIVCCTSSEPGSNTWTSLEKKGVQVRHASFDDKASIEKALAGCDKFFLVSTPKIEMDYNDAPLGQGREKHHFTAIDAAQAAGVKHIYYSSLAFQSPSKSRVMQAHIRTEAYLADLQNIDYTLLREGLYNESWPLYASYYHLNDDQRSEVPIGGDSPISWTAISDLGLASALVIVAPSSEYAAKTFYLSATQGARTIKEVLEKVSAVKSKKVTTKIVSREELESYYVRDIKLSEPAAQWWAASYDALRDQECLINDPTLEKLLASKGRKPIPVEETIEEMLRA